MAVHDRWTRQILHSRIRCVVENLGKKVGAVVNDSNIKAGEKWADVRSSEFSVMLKLKRKHTSLDLRPTIHLRCRYPGFNLLLEYNFCKSAKGKATLFSYSTRLRLNAFTMLPEPSLGKYCVEVAPEG